MRLSTSHIEVDRATLFNEVWETPLSRLAPRYGISDVALKKVCRRMGIPTPPRGHWARVHHAHPVRRPRLPAPGPDTPLTHTFHVHPTLPDKAAPEQKKTELPAAVKAAAETTAVADALRAPDPFVAQTRDALNERLKLRRPGNNDRVSSWGPDTLDVSVCPDSVTRALRLLDAILKGARRAGFDIEAGVARGEGSVRLIVEGEALAFRLREAMRQEKVDPPKGERYWFGDRVRLHPTGRLTLELMNTRNAPRHTWRDTERQRLEDLVGSFLVGAYKAALATREWNLERERRRAEERRQEEERQRLERLREEEVRRRRRLEEQAERWRRSQDVAAFVDEVARRAAAAPLEGEAKEALDAWLAWAREHAERLDPLSRGLPPFPEPVETRRRIL